MPNQTKFRLGWVIAVLAMAGLACTCGALGQVQQGVQTAQALATQGQQLATQAVSLETQGVALATQVEQSGLLKTAQAGLTEVATGGALETLQALGTQIDQSGALGTAQALASQASGGPTTSGVPDDVPIYPENANLMVLSTNLIAYTAGADLSSVTEFYKSELAAKGWQPARDPILSDVANILLYKKDNRTITLNLAAAGSATSVGIKLQP